MTFSEFWTAEGIQSRDKLKELITNIFQVKSPTEGETPDPTLPNDKLAIFADIDTYLATRYESANILYTQGVMDRMIYQALMSNAMEFAKLITIWRSAYLEYEKLIIGDTQTGINEFSYSGLNAAGVYSSTNNTSSGGNPFDNIRKMINSAQTEAYLFLDRIIQPHLQLIY